MKNLNFCNRRFFYLLAFLFFISTGKGTACYQDSLKLWKSVKQSKIKSLGKPTIHAKKFSVLKLNKTKLDKLFSDTTNAIHIITLPIANDKTYRTFVIEKSQVMAPELAKKYPEIKSYAGYDKVEKNITLRLDINPTGLHAMIKTTEGEYYIEPFNKNTRTYYIVFFKEDVEKTDVSPYSNPDVVK